MSEMLVNLIRICPDSVRKLIHESARNLVNRGQKADENQRVIINLMGREHLFFNDR